MMLRGLFFFLVFVYLAGCVQQEVADFDEPIATVKSLNPACNQLEQRINSLMASVGQCNTADDCTAGKLGSCEFGCYLVKNKGENASQIVELVKQFESQRCSTCVVPCDLQPTEFACIQRKCVVLAPKEFQ